MELLIIASLLFLVTHLGVSSTPLRQVLANNMGEGPYLALYSVLAAVTLGAMIYTYGQTSHASFIWLPSRPANAATLVLVPIALILIVSGLMAKNPTAVGMSGAVNADLAAILKITRHPVQWGIMLWALAHLLANGDGASIVFFGTFMLLSGVGMAAMDAKRRGRPEPAWQQFYRGTSAIPFVALITGKNTLKFSEINWIAVVIGLVVAVLAYVFHPWLSGTALM